MPRVGLWYGVDGKNKEAGRYLTYRTYLVLHYLRYLRLVLPPKVEAPTYQWNYSSPPLRILYPRMTLSLQCCRHKQDDTISVDKPRVFYSKVHLLAVTLHSKLRYPTLCTVASSLPEVELVD